MKFNRVNFQKNGAFPMESLIFRVSIVKVLQAHRSLEVTQSQIFRDDSYYETKHFSGNSPFISYVP